ncbi:hypothetical protein D9611_014680 [Ephemerocybe angulata]|uniref:Uncharacterized protein n=1 Tax=Ephemerocybe angulata TaxID=980116 RepID=A0A8H5B800_9AGAR|nr:hypothetical protein D9611_014680 [Tulosesus angulatus]
MLSRTPLLTLVCLSLYPGLFVQAHVPRQLAFVNSLFTPAVDPQAIASTSHSETVSFGISFPGNEVVNGDFAGNLGGFLMDTDSDGDSGVTVHDESDDVDNPLASFQPTNLDLSTSGSGQAAVSADSSSGVSQRREPPSAERRLLRKVKYAAPNDASPMGQALPEKGTYSSGTLTSRQAIKALYRKRQDSVDTSGVDGFGNTAEGRLDTLYSAVPPDSSVSAPPSRVDVSKPAYGRRQDEVTVIDDDLEEDEETLDDDVASDASPSETSTTAEPTPTPIDDARSFLSGRQLVNGRENPTSSVRLTKRQDEVTVIDDDLEDDEQMLDDDVASDASPSETSSTAEPTPTIDDARSFLIGRRLASGREKHSISSERLASRQDAISDNLAALAALTPSDEKTSDAPALPIPGASSSSFSLADIVQPLGSPFSRRVFG